MGESHACHVYKCHRHAGSLRHKKGAGVTGGGYEPLMQMWRTELRPSNNTDLTLIEPRFSVSVFFRKSLFMCTCLYLGVGIGRGIQVSMEVGKGHRIL